MQTFLSSRIYKADQRGVENAGGRNACCTFSFGNYREPHREPFGALHFLNDESLAPQCSFTYRHEHATTVLLLPVVGGADVMLREAEELFVHTEQAACFTVEAGAQYTIANPHERETASFLHIGFRIPQEQHAPRVSSFSFGAGNTLASLEAFDAAQNIRASAGLYSGRAEGAYIPQCPENAVFVYIINGAFEVQHCLLEYRDGLALTAPGAVEFEALSENAIVLVLEIPPVHNGIIQSK